MNTRYRKFLLILGGIITAFLILELASRFLLPPSTYILVKNTNQRIEDSSTDRNIIFDNYSMPILFLETKTGYRLRKNMNIVVMNEDLSGKDIKISTNSLGYRGPQIPEKEENDFRILVIGDSITLADHVDFSEIYTTKLEKFLKSNPQVKKSGKNIQVINAGIGGTGAQTQLAIFTELFPKVKPDMVIFQMYLNDANSSFMLMIAKAPEFIRNSKLLSLLYSVYSNQVANSEYRAFANTRDVIKAKEKFSQKKMSDENWKEKPEGLNKLIYDSMADWGYAWDSDFNFRIKKVYTLIKEVSDSQNIELFVVMTPVSYQIQAEYVNDLPQRQTEKVMKELGIEFYDLLPDLRAKYEEDKKDIFFDHCHFIPEGHLFLGQKIGEQILNKIK